MMVYERIIALLEQSGFDYTIHSHQPICTIQEAREKVVHLTRNLLKTVVFKIKHDHWILAAVLGSDRIDYKKLAQAFEVKRTDLRSVSPEEVRADLGFQVGGVGPFPIREDVHVVFDEHLMGLDTVFCGMGINTRTVEMKLDHLVQVAQARIHPITRSTSVYISARMRS